MTRKRKKKKSLPPRCRRMKRSARLQSAVSWLRKYKGRNVLRGYCKHFGVDWRCAQIELERLGVKIDMEYLECRTETERRLIMERQRRQESGMEAEADEDWPPYESAFEAYLAGDFAALHALEQAELDATSSSIDTSEDNCIPF